jgi:hypothetical protein
MKVARWLGLMFGLVMLLLGGGFVVIDLDTKVSALLNHDLNFHPVTTFPLGTIAGVPCLWLGYRLAFTKPVRPKLPRFGRPRFKTEP